MAILIVGASSFIGNALKIYASEMGLEVVSSRRCENSGAYCSHGDERFFCLSRDGKPFLHPNDKFEAIFLFSTVYSRDPSNLKSIIECNIDFLSNIIINLEMNTKKFIYSNSYMALPEVLNFQSSLYAHSKSLFSIFSKGYLQHSQFENIYLFDIYGPGDKRKKFVNLVLDAHKNRTQLIASSGNQLLAPLSVNDAVKVLFDRIHIDERYKFTDFILRGSTWNTLKELVKITEEVSGFELPVLWGGVPDNSDSIYKPIDTYQNLSAEYEIMTTHEIIESICSEQ